MIIKLLQKLKTPEFEILTLDELKTFCRIAHTFEDDSIKEFRDTAVELIEKNYLLSIYKKQLTAIYKAPKVLSDNMRVTQYTKDPDEVFSGIDLKYGPIISVDNIQLIKFNFDTIDNFTDYSFMPECSRIRYNNSCQIHNQDVEYIKVTYTAGFDEADMPAEIKTAIRYIVLNLYEKDDTFNPLTQKVGDLLSKYKDNAWYL
jgi:hypothetical protein